MTLGLLVQVKNARAKARVTRPGPKERSIMQTENQNGRFEDANQRERLIRQLQQKTDDIVAPLRTQGQHVSALFHCREHEQPAYDLTILSLREDQAKEIVKLLASKHQSFHTTSPDP